MGMDLKSRKPNGEVYAWGRFNWTGWSQFGQLLDDLGCDTSEMQGSNDGAYIKKATCKEWAKAVRDALASKRIGLVKTPSRHYSGGFKESFTVDNGTAIALKADDVEWLLQQAEYFDNCGGCRQY